MIEVRSAPETLSSWDGDNPPFYLEVFGETSPVLDLNFAEVIPPRGSSPETTTSTPVYEYWWTMGHREPKSEHDKLNNRREKELFKRVGNEFKRVEQELIHRSEDEPIWSHLADDAAEIELYFPTDCGWRVKELVATVKYLSPPHDQLSFSERANAEWEKLQPLLADAGTLASALGPVPVVGAPAVAASPILVALSKLQVGSVPPSVAGYNWYVKKVTTGVEGTNGVMQGVTWSIPRTMFESLGGRLTGSLAVSFIQSKQQGASDSGLKAGNLVGRAGVFEKEPRKKEDAAHWSDLVQLSILPVQPAAARATAPTSTTS